LASAHLHFGILSHLPDLFAKAERVLLVSNRSEAMDALMRQYPGHRIDRIAVGTGRRPFPAAPHFLGIVEAALPRDLRGCLCLVGAGPWAEIYCGWLKQRGGVGVDLGSGFDLLAGKITRPVHRSLGLSEDNPYVL
jgi:hypothetical protein